MELILVGGFMVEIRMGRKIGIIVWDFWVF
jgi:hypothetical protein